MLTRMLKYLEEAEPDRGTVTVFSLSPEDIVFFMQSMDATARTQVHESDCPHWGATVYAPCGCPKRAKAETLRAAKSGLQMSLKEAGLTSAWCPFRLMGNPCMAVQVDRYIDLLEKEQSAAGVKTCTCRPR